MARSPAGLRDFSTSYMFTFTNDITFATNVGTLIVNVNPPQLLIFPKIVRGARTLRTAAREGRFGSLLALGGRARRLAGGS